MMKKLSSSYVILIVVLGSITITTVLAQTVTITYPYTLQDSSNNQPLVITSSGNVGIGTSTPATTLEVNGIETIDQEAILGRQNFVNLQAYPNDMDKGTLNFYDAQNFPANNNYFRSLDIVAGGGNVLSAMRFLTVPSGDSSGAPTEAMRIDYTGNVGIGTSTPAEKLDVAGNIQLTGNIVSPNDICIGSC